ncbi:hypothetical protein [Alkalicoccobacillus plakortidis]|uniref:Uncharacterized protein n=1 Tax=Alkalicoccobacillus plakortidis TaxID=444060 RepID=A0ABT0XPT7_9BACI|nr:hypothetical protein [Alkalicoccobacillus plakortidis]MCM2677919.1 hypothetical protein [Alkalicoccobacillus plakortidis]
MEKWLGIRRELADALIGKSEEVSEVSDEFNHSEDVQGRYRSARAVETGPMKIMPFLSDSDSVISANSDGSINLTVAAMGVDVDYIETSPYLFERVSSENTLLDNAGMNTNKLFFKTNENGDVVMLTRGNIADELPVPFTESLLFFYVLIGSAAILSIGGLVWGVIRSIRNYRRAKRNQPLIKSLLYRGATLWSLVGVLTVVNFVMILLQLASNPFQEWSNFTVHVIVFWVLILAAIVSLYPIGKGWRVQQGSYVIKVFIILVGLSLIGLFYILFFINFLFIG